LNLSGKIKTVGRKFVKNMSPKIPLKGLDFEQRVWALVLVRMGSVRFPNKAVAEVVGIPAIEHLILRLKQANSINQIVVCTTAESADDQIVEVAKKNGVAYFRGNKDDVLGRMLGAIHDQDVDVVIRVTGDDILVDPDYIDLGVKYHLDHKLDYSDMKQLPSGTEVEIFNTSILYTIWDFAEDRSNTEYLTYYVQDNRSRFKMGSVPIAPEHQHNWRLTMDTPDDYKVILQLLESMDSRGKKLRYRLDDIRAFFEEHPEVLLINQTKEKDNQMKQSPINTKLNYSKLR
jgi:spore coat polysaccharide biosynthesis protein SpsF